MTALVERLRHIWVKHDLPFLVRGTSAIRFSQVEAAAMPGLSQVRSGDVVALIGDMDPASVATLLRLVDLGAIVMPLTLATAREHGYFLDAGHVDMVLGPEGARPLPAPPPHPLIERLRDAGRAGLILFSTGTTGRPKAILHDFETFLQRFDEPRPALRTLAFLLFDHIGGINTLLHALFNRGMVVAPEERTVAAVLRCCAAWDVEVLPATPTFLRMLLLSGQVPDAVPPSLRIVTYGTERMDQPTLSELAAALPEVDFRQTFGMSELGIVRVKSERRDSLFMRVGGTGVETRVRADVLEIRSSARMLGYLNAPSPFDAQGWYDTRDLVEQRGEWFRIVGRSGDVVNVGGLKFMLSEVEAAALELPGVALVRASARANPVTGEHVELLAQIDPAATLDASGLRAHLMRRLPPHMVPQRVRTGPVAVGHRFKRL